MSPKLPRELDVELQQILGERYTTNESVREHHGADESWHQPQPPNAVCFPSNLKELSGIVASCNRVGFPIIPFGAGSGCEGGVIAIRGGVCVDLSTMNSILEVRPEDLDCSVQAGVTRKQLNHHLRHSGLFFPVDPGYDATLGGMASTRASGTNAVRYGTMKENVLSLTVVTADGTIMRTASRARKSSAGYDLTHLYVGAEGTLGIIAELTLRLYGQPAAEAVAIVSFREIDNAVNAAIQIIQLGVSIARIELVDSSQMAAINIYSHTDYPEEDTLIMEFHGTSDGIHEQAEMVGQICRDLGGGGFKWSEKAEEKKQLWQARHDAAFAAMATRPGAKGYSTDVCVPISRLAQCISETRADLKKNCTIPNFILGHVGDGNFHCVMLADPASHAERAQVLGVSERLAHRAIEHGGTCTGEHGVGIGKQKYLMREFGEIGISSMRKIKQSLDPNNIFNPGKIFSS